MVTFADENLVTAAACGDMLPSRFTDEAQPDMTATMSTADTNLIDDIFFSLSEMNRISREGVQSKCNRKLAEQNWRWATDSKCDERTTSASLMPWL